ncbi:hypothetical protein [Pseudobutyrivibrio sp.]
MRKNFTVWFKGLDTAADFDRRLANMNAIPNGMMSIIFDPNDDHVEIKYHVKKTEQKRFFHAIRKYNDSIKIIKEAVS